MSIHFFNMLETLDINILENGTGEAKHDFVVCVFFQLQLLICGVNLLHLVVSAVFMKLVVYC